MLGPWLVKTLYQTIFKGANVKRPKYVESITTIGMAMVAPEIKTQVQKVRYIRLRSNISKAIGRPISPANGQPKSVEIATKNMASGYFLVHQAANAEQPKYMANEDGKRAALDMNMPTLKS